MLRRDAHIIGATCGMLAWWMAMDCTLDVLRRWCSKRSPIPGSWSSTALGR